MCLAAFDHLALDARDRISDLALVQLVSTGCANFVAFGGRLMKNRQQLLCMLS